MLNSGPTRVVQNVAFPIEALIGDLPPEVLLGGLVMQGLWIVIGASLARRSFAIAIKRYSAVGG